MIGGDLVRVFKRAGCLLMTVCMLLGSVHVSTAAERYELAEAVLGTTAGTVNINSVKMGANSEIHLAERDGRSGWTLKSINGLNSALLWQKSKKKPLEESDRLYFLRFQNHSRW